MASGFFFNVGVSATTMAIDRLRRHHPSVHSFVRTRYKIRFGHLFLFFSPVFFFILFLLVVFSFWMLPSRWDTYCFLHESRRAGEQRLADEATVPLPILEGGNLDKCVMFMSMAVL